tara:strand:- start:2677 stop:3633 length:957 start_codon:yes stop_codon:yes gene_type:complete
MAVFTNHAAVGSREDLQDVIYSISPTDTPFMNSIGQGKASGTLHEWQTDALASVNVSNAAIEGADASTATLSATTRLNNQCQILQKTISVSRTLEAVDKAGRKSEQAYQLAKASKEIKRDLEAILLSNQVKDAGSAAEARTMGGLQTWINTNGDFGSAGVAGSLGSTARTDSSEAERAFTETILKTVVKEVYEAGGDPSMLLVSPSQKQVVSGFAGIAAQRYMAPADAPTTIIGAADVYMSDFGTISVVPDRFMLASNSADDIALVLDPEFLEVNYLRPFTTNDLAVAGDQAAKQQIVTECTLGVLNEGAHGICADLS